MTSEKGNTEFIDDVAIESFHMPWDSDIESKFSWDTAFHKLKIKTFLMTQKQNLSYGLISTQLNCYIKISFGMRQEIITYGRHKVQIYKQKKIRRKPCEKQKDKEVTILQGLKKGGI